MERVMTAVFRALGGIVAAALVLLVALSLPLVAIVALAGVSVAYVVRDSRT